jgi:hypothetical protein
MRILLDECVPWPIHQFFAEHDCVAAQQRGWGGIRNGDLLRRAEGEFALFITADQSLRYQQNLTGYTVAILQLSTNNWRRIRAAAALIQAEVASIQPGEFRKLQIP